MRKKFSQKERLQLLRASARSMIGHEPSEPHRIITYHYEVMVNGSVRGSRDTLRREDERFLRAARRLARMLKTPASVLLYERAGVALSSKGHIQRWDELFL